MNSGGVGHSVIHTCYNLFGDVPGLSSIGCPYVIAFWWGYYQILRSYDYNNMHLENILTSGLQAFSAGYYKNNQHLITLCLDLCNLIVQQTIWIILVLELKDYEFQYMYMGNSTVTELQISLGSYLITLCSTPMISVSLNIFIRCRGTYAITWNTKSVRVLSCLETSGAYVSH